MPKATRVAFGETLARLGETHPEIVALDADLSKSTRTDFFAKRFPDRFFEMGIAEANMIGTAAGLSFAGKIPFAASFGCFLTGRYDIIRLSAAYAQANVRFVGTHAGVGIGDDGHSQMGLEDISLMRSLPTMGVFQPMDARETEHIVEFLVKEWKGPAYLRLTRQAVPDLFPSGGVFRAGKLMEIERASGGPKKVTCIATGAVVAEAVKASQALVSQGIAMSVWNCHSLKPYDEETTIRISKDAGLVVTVEDHSVIGGLGTCVAETFAHCGAHPRLMKLGIQDQFGESGEPDELYEKFGISAAAIARSVARAVAGE